MADNKSIISNYLQEVAKQDPVFAEHLADPKKSIDACMNYITGKAKKMAVKGCAMVEDKVVFGWAVHYYCEDMPEISATAEVKVVSKQSAEPKQKAPQKAKKPAKNESLLQLSLF